MTIRKLTAGEVLKFWMRRPQVYFQALKTFSSETLESHEGEERSQFRLELKAQILAQQFWKELVEKVGEFRARDILRGVMLEDEPGRPKDHILSSFIYVHIRLFGLEESDERIAKRIVESRPEEVWFESGERVIVNEWVTEANTCFGETIVERVPFKKGLKAIAKQVERTRREFIEDGILPKEYAPRKYYRG